MTGLSKGVWGGGVAATAILAVCAWAFWHAEKDPGLDEIKRLAEAQGDDAGRDAMRAAIEQRTAGLTDEQKGDFFREKLMPLMMPMMAKRFSDDYDKLMAMTPDERNRELDRRIDQMRQFGAQRGPRGGGPPGGQPPSPTQINAMRGRMLDLTTPDQRGKMENAMRLMGDRMKQRGITPPPGPGGGFF